MKRNHELVQRFSLSGSSHGTLHALQYSETKEKQRPTTSVTGCFLVGPDPAKQAQPPCQNSHERCPDLPTFCLQRAAGMIDARHPLCKADQCTRQPSFGMEVRQHNE